MAFAYLLSAAILLSAELTGTWHGDGGPLGTITLRLEQTGNSVSGSEEFMGKVFPFEGGDVDRDRITFSISIPVGGRLQQATAAGNRGNGEIRLRGFANVVLKRVEPEPGASRIERLASLIRLWGTIRFFHPFVASKPIGWDSAFIAAVPLAEKAAPRDDFVRAVSGMPAALDDSETRVLADNAPESLPIACQCREIVRSGFIGAGPSSGGDYYADWENVPRRAQYIMKLWNGVRVAIRTAAPVSADTGLRSSDAPYAGDLPAREYRLLGLARYWNAIHFFALRNHCLVTP